MFVSDLDDNEIDDLVFGETDQRNFKNLGKGAKHPSKNQFSQQNDDEEATGLLNDQADLINIDPDQIDAQSLQDEESVDLLTEKHRGNISL